jgi:glycosyltransferase involved in cell wall biosynthesis
MEKYAYTERVSEMVVSGVVSGQYRFEQDVPGGVRDDYQHVRPVNWLYTDVGLSILPLNDDTQFTQKTIYPIDRFSWSDLLVYLQQSGKQPLEASQLESTDAKKPYVLIIDEINRGNISRIFGELITLIEHTKRAGASEALTITLPYSKKPFSVPDNLYIIGTMNTADHIITVSNLTRQTVIEKYHIDPAKVTTVHNAVEPLSDEIKSIEVPHSPKEKVVTFLGRITMQKGPEYFVEAAARVLKKTNRVRFVMAGSGDMMDKMILLSASHTHRWPSTFHKPAFLSKIR